MERTCRLLSAAIIFCAAVPAAVPSHDSCQRIMEKGENFTCTYTRGDCPATISWLDLDPPPTTLIQTNVSNGTQYSCQLVCGGQISTAIYTLEVGYAVSIEKFAVNGMSDNLTINGDKNLSMTLLCNVTGVPDSTFVLAKQTGDDLDILHGEYNISGSVATLTYTVDEVTCEDMGIYTCFADNDRKSLQIYVNCAPRPQQNGFPNTRGRPPELTTEGLTFDLLLYPIPDSFVYYVLQSSNDSTGRPASPEVQIQTRASQRHASVPLATFSIQPVTLPEKHLGVYYVEVSNELGSLRYFFQVNTAVGQKSEETPVVIIVGSTVSGLALIIVTVVIILCVRRRKHLAYEKPMQRRQQYANLQRPKPSDQLPSVGYFNTQPRLGFGRSDGPRNSGDVSDIHAYDPVEPPPEPCARDDSATKPSKTIELKVDFYEITEPAEPKPPECSGGRVGTLEEPQEVHEYEPVNPMPPVYSPVHTSTESACSNVDANGESYDMNVYEQVEVKWTHSE